MALPVIHSELPLIVYGLKTVNEERSVADTQNQRKNRPCYPGAGAFHLTKWRVVKSQYALGRETWLRGLLVES